MGFFFAPKYRNPLQDSKPMKIEERKPENENRE